MFIGEDLNEKQIAVLQAVADACCGARFARIRGTDTSVTSTIEQTPRNFKVLHDPYGHATGVDTILRELEAKWLVELKEIKGHPHVGLTEDGARCNLIDNPFPL
jgi:hypothetical protein